MKKIVFNGEYFIKEKPTGIERYTFELLNELNKIVYPGEIDILAPKCNFDPSTFDNIKFRMIGNLGKNNIQEKAFGRIWKYIIFPLYCRLNNAFAINTGIAWRFFSFNAATIHDCIPELFPDFSTSKSLKKLVQKQKTNCENCDFILTVSECSKKDINKIYRVPLDKIEVVPNAWQHFNRAQEDQEILDKLGLSESNYFFSLGSRSPHKNIKWVNFAAQKHPQYCFVVTGTRLGKTDTSFEGEIPDNMLFTGYLKDGEIKSLMRHCKAFIQPSLYEGFGIPPMEAMSVGADCIVSNAGALPEVYRNSVWYIDPYDYDNINLDEIMSRPKDSNAIVLNEYSWEKSAKMLLEILRRRAQ